MTGQTFIRQAMNARPQAPYCSICNHAEPRCGPDAIAVVCSRCTYTAAEKFAAPKPPKLTDARESP